MNYISRLQDRIITIKDDMYKVKGVITGDASKVSRDDLGYLVAYYGGNKLIQEGNKVVVLEKIEEALLETC